MIKLNRKSWCCKTMQRDSNKSVSISSPEYSTNKHKFVNRNSCACSVLRCTLARFNNWYMKRCDEQVIMLCYARARLHWPWLYIHLQHFNADSPVNPVQLFRFASAIPRYNSISPPTRGPINQCIIENIQNYSSAAVRCGVVFLRQHNYRLWWRWRKNAVGPIDHVAAGRLGLCHFNRAAVSALECVASRTRTFHVRHSYQASNTNMVFHIPVMLWCYGSKYWGFSMISLNWLANYLSSVGIMNSI